MAKIVKKADENLDTKKLVLYILKIAGITLCSMFIGFFYVLSVLMAFSPSSVAKVFNVVGSDKAVTICYEQMYKNNPSNENLYNLIVQAVKTDDNVRVEAYCSAIKASKNYSDFEKEINTILRSRVSKDKVAYVYDVDAYLTAAYIKALYNQGEKEYARQEFHVNDIQRTDHPYTISLVTYVNCLYDDESLTKEEKSSLLSDYMYVGVILNGKTMMQCLEEKLAAIESTEETTIEGKIYNIYSQIKVNTCFFTIYDIIGNNEAKEQYSQKVSSLTQQYNELINS